MQKSVATLLNGILDYAGLFPPEKLPFYDAIHAFRRYREHAYAPMMARFVIPIAQLPLVHQEVGDIIARSPSKTPWVFSVLGTPTADPDDFLESLEKDIRSIRKFLDSYKQGDVIVDGFEVLFPKDLISGSTKEIVSILSEIQNIWSTLPGVARIFFELPYREIKHFRTIVEAIHVHNKNHRDNIAAKLRTGGLTPDAVPSASELAEAIIHLNEADVAFKCTAGLHQPLRHFDKAVGADVHGFLNVWATAMASKIHKANLSQMCEILNSTQKNDFLFSADKMNVKSFSFSTEQIAFARQNCALSFGSCSFEEPLEYLQKMEMLS